MLFQLAMNRKEGQIYEEKTIFENPYAIVALLNSTNILKPDDIVIIKVGTYSLGDDDRIRIAASGSFEKSLTIKGKGTVKLCFSKMSFNSANRSVTIARDYITWDGNSGLQIGRDNSEQSDISDWPSYNLIQNCTSYNNYDNETYADGFAAKLTVGYGNVFDGCIAYRNSDNGWDL